MRKSRWAAGAAAAVAAGMLLTACGSDAGGNGASSDGDGVTITWWHNSNNEPGLGYYQQVAEDFMADNPGVTIEISAMQHEDMGTKLDAAMQSGDMPDIFMERGGGEMADKIDAGLIRDLTDDAAETIEKLGGSVAGWTLDGRTYALPFSIGVVGFWYNTALFEEAGITDTPTTMDELFETIDALKAAGIDPISVGAGEGWPAAHYWYYFALRECSEEALNTAVSSLQFDDPCFIRAGEALEELIAAEPFNPGFLSTPAQAGATSASGLLATGKVAMELAGHWEPGVMQGLTDDGQGLGENTGWFPFPTTPTGEGDPTAALGGGDAWALSGDAPDEALEFIEYLLSDDVQQGFAENDMGLPTNPAAVDSISDPALAGLLEVRDSAPYVQLYLDTAFGQAVGGAMNDEIALLFAGQATAQDVVDAIEQAAGTAG